MRRALVLLVLVVAAAAILLRAGCDGGQPVPEVTGGSEPVVTPADLAHRPAPDRPRAGRAARPEEATAAPGAGPDVVPPVPATTEVVPASEPTVLPEGEIPEADRGTGECTLDLDLRDPVTDAPLEGKVRLWRLGVPADAKWPAGDHVQVALDHRGTSPRLVTGLPPGLYRAEVLCAAPGADDPPSFVVDGARTDVRIGVAAPAVLPARVRIFDESGSRVWSASVGRGGSGGTAPVPMRAPAWANPRNPLPAGTNVGRGGGWRSLRSGYRDIRIEAGPDGAFEVGKVRGPGRAQTWSATWTLRPENRSAVRATFRSEDVVNGDLVGVSVPLAQFADVVVHLPDGRLARDAGAQTEASCDAVVAAPDAAGIAWQTIPVRVKVTLAGYADVEFEWRVGEALPGPFTMNVAPP